MWSLQKERRPPHLSGLPFLRGKKAGPKRQAPAPPKSAEPLRFCGEGSAEELTFAQNPKFCRTLLAKPDFQTLQFFLPIRCRYRRKSGWTFPQSTPNMTGRRFHRTMEVIPALPWKAKSPSVSRLSKLNIKQGDARGASEVRRRTSSIHFHCPVPWSSSHIAHRYRAIPN